MSLNCKPGDLAMFVGEDFPHQVGKITRVIEPSTNPYGALPAWRIEPSLGGFKSALDCCLRPIRDPGDDARDETLVFAGKPKSDTAPMVTKEAA